MELELRNLKGTNDYLPEEQYLRNNIRKTLENVFVNYGYLPLETPVLCYYDMLASKYAGGSEILKEVYKLKDQGERELALRYDLTVPFAKVMGINPNLRMPFKRYEIGRVYRDGPVKLGRNREFIQCDVDVAGIKSTMAEAELISMVFDVFDRLKLDVYVSYNNRKLLSGIVMGASVPEMAVNDFILSLDKTEKIGKAAVCREMAEKGIDSEAIDRFFSMVEAAGENLQDYLKKNQMNSLISDGLRELEELNGFLFALGLLGRVRFNPFLARGLDIYTGTVYEIFLSDGSITSSIGGGGRYDSIIGCFLNNGNEYPAVGISFGLDVIYTALSMKSAKERQSSIDLFIIPMGTEAEALKLAYELRLKGISVDIEMSGKKLKKSLEYANKERIPYILVLGEDELVRQTVRLKDMFSGNEQLLPLSELPRAIKKTGP